MIFMIFELSVWNLNLIACRASKIISYDAKLEPISWNLNIVNPLLNFCVGVWVGGSLTYSVNYLHRSKDVQKNQHLLIPVSARRPVESHGANMERKLKITGVKIAWVHAAWIMHNQISTTNFIYENDQRNKINIAGDFENEDVAHANRYCPRKFQNWAKISKIELPGNWTPLGSIQQRLTDSQSGKLTYRGFHIKLYPLVIGWHALECHTWSRIQLH